MMTKAGNNSDLSHRKKQVLESINSDRNRTNLLKTLEQKAIVYLVQRIPSWMTSDMLTAIGFLGNLTVSAAFVLAAYFGRNYLLMGILGFVINWFGDSLDGRLAYFRKRPRKKYGFTLDTTIDWIGIIMIGFGFIFYTKGPWELLGYFFVVMYGWEMIIALIRFKMTGRHTIDSGFLGPTEARILIIIVILSEVLVKGLIHYFAFGISVILFIVNVLDTHHLLRVTERMDIEELERKERETKG
jgi:phosphatidylglycerophosphate synthase